MTDAVTLTKNETSTALPTEIPPSQAASTTLRDQVREFLRQYFIRLQEVPPINLYELILAEIEAPMLEIVLQYVGKNQSQAARLLAMSRGTLRKKMQLYQVNAYAEYFLNFLFFGYK
jgi:Fis family transcriptional regulator, factor for inversion stimulation protein